MHRRGLVHADLHEIRVRQQLSVQRPRIAAIERDAFRGKQFVSFPVLRAGLKLPQAVGGTHRRSSA